jgi:hypothetical protein
MAFKRKKLIFLLIAIVNDYHLYYCAGVSIIQTNIDKDDIFITLFLNIRLGGIA